MAAQEGSGELLPSHRVGRNFRIPHHGAPTGSPRHPRAALPAHRPPLLSLPSQPSLPIALNALSGLIFCPEPMLPAIELPL